MIHNIIKIESLPKVKLGTFHKSEGQSSLASTKFVDRPHLQKVMNLKIKNRFTKIVIFVFNVLFSKINFLAQGQNCELRFRHDKFLFIGRILVLSCKSMKQFLEFFFYFNDRYMQFLSLEGEICKVFIFFNFYNMDKVQICMQGQ